MFADPLIGAGFGAKVARVGLLGAHMGPRGTLNMVAANERAAALLDTMHAGEGVSSLARVDEIAARGEALSSGQLAEGTAKLDDTVPAIELPRIDSLKPRPESDPMAQFYYDLHKVDADGNRVMTLTDLAKRPEFKAMDKGLATASLLYDSKSYAESILVVNALAGHGASLSKLEKMAPAMADEIYRLKRAQYWELSLKDPDKKAEIEQSLGAQWQELNTLIEAKTKVLSDLETATGMAKAERSMSATEGFKKGGPEYLAMSQQVASLRKAQGQV